MKLYGLIMALASTLAWGANEVASYAEGLAHVREDGWVLLCYSGDWDATHDGHWMRRQTAISSACGNALLLYLPIFQNPTPEQTERLAAMLQGTPVDLSKLSSVPCAILLDDAGRPYTTISGDDFTERAAGLIRQAQAQLRTRNDLLRQASLEEGASKAQTLSSLWRLSIDAPANLHEQIRTADPADEAGVAEWANFDPWAFARKVEAMPWQEAIAELERAAKAPLSPEERQAVVAIRIGCVHHHLGAAGAKEIRSLANTCASHSPDSPLGKAARRAAELWGKELSLEEGWNKEVLPRIAADCEAADSHKFTRAGEYRITFEPKGGQDALRVTRVTLYDGEEKMSEDAHACELPASGELKENEYVLFVREAPTKPRFVISFDQQGKVDTRGAITVSYFTPDGDADKLQH